MLTVIVQLRHFVRTNPDAHHTIFYLPTTKTRYHIQNGLKAFELATYCTN